MPDKILVCVAWPYANGDLHIGHIAGAYLPADVFARYQRLKGNEVLVVSGSDTHGTPITVRADQEGVTPRDIVDRFHPRFLETMQQLGISFDLFTETDTENHWAVTQDMFLRLLHNGYLYRDRMKALYCEKEQRFLPDRYVEGTCPHCGYTDARGDQCDNCGRTLDAVDLIEPRCKFDGTRPVARETEHFFLDLAKLNLPLLEWVKQKEGLWRPNVLNFTFNMLASGELRGRPITRDIAWGIPVPVAGFEDKRIYVWFDAVIGYFAATIEWAQITGRPEVWHDWWQNPAARHYYFIGKDNIPFHTVIWPAMLYGYGGLNLPYDVPANEYLNVEGRQLSKSRRWVIEVLDFLTRYDPDSLRYILTANMPEAKDLNFTWDEFVRRNNDELVATWGNLANRVLTFAFRNFAGRVPEPGPLQEADEALLKKVDGGFAVVGDLLDGCHFKAAVTEAMGLAQEANRYLNDRAPWQQIKSDRAAAARTIYVCLRVIDSLKTLFTPFLPFSCQRLHEYLGYQGNLFGQFRVEQIREKQKTHLALRFDPADSMNTWRPSSLAPGQALRQPAPLFKKLDDSIVAEEVQRMTSGR
ncbi:MAG: methionine--tRNA ligase [Anaerolineae bacterium]|nr:methionine--tRNA ligase [Anaerolineae bacterium]